MTTSTRTDSEHLRTAPMYNGASSCPGAVPLGRSDLWLAAALAAIVLAAGSFRLVVGVCGIYHDDAVYVNTAKALAEGEGYRLINVLGSPVQTRFPILYPALLSIVWRVWPAFPANLQAMQGISLLAAAATVGLAYLYFVRFGYFSRGVAAASGLLCGTSVSFLYFGTQTLSEMPFALLLLAAVWALDREARMPGFPLRRQVLVGVLLGLPFLCRSIGVVLIPIGLLILYRAGRSLRWVIGGLAATTLPWILWTLTTGNYDPLEGYNSDYLSWWSSLGLPLLGQVFASNVVLLALSTASLSFEGLTVALFSAELGRGPIIVALILGTIPWVAILARVRLDRVLPCVLVAYVVAILCWPWPPFRFLVPILPFLVPYMLRAASALSGCLLPPRRCAALTTIGLGVAVGANVTLLYRHCELSRRTGYSYNSLADTRVSWSSYEGVFDWLGTHARTDDLVASGVDPMIYLYTGLQGFRPFVGRPASLFYGNDLPPVGTIEDLIEVFQTKRPRFLVQFPMPGFGEEKHFAELLAELRVNHPGWLDPVYQGEDERFVIFELRSEMEPPVRSAESSQHETLLLRQQ